MIAKTHLVVHHSATKDGASVSWGAIRNYHVERLRWRDIGYHVGVELVNDHYEMLLGRSFLDRAAAAYQQSMNLVGVHVCFVGNYDLVPPSREMIEYAAPRLRDICEMLGIELDSAHVIGHREVANKTCPGSMFDVDDLLGAMQRAG